MSDTGTGSADPQAGADDVSPLGRMLDLTEEEVSALGAIFAEATRPMGVDGSAIFARLRQGESLGKALALPAELRELLYARAHRWFSLARYERAEPLFRALCILEEGSSDYWIGYGVCLRLRDDLETAGVAFDTAAKLRPDWAVPHFHALELAVHRQDWDAAAMHLSAYDQRKPEDLAEPIRAEVERLRAVLAVRQSPAAT